MHPDPIVTEVRKIREAYAASLNHDVRAIGQDARQRDAAGDRPIVRRPPRPAANTTLVRAKTA